MNPSPTAHSDPEPDSFALLAAHGPGGERHAALLLHGLGEADREWVLNALGPGERQRVLGLLEELRGLRIAPDADLVRDSIGQHVAAPAPIATHDCRSRLSRLGAHEVRALAEMLQHEPPRLAAQCLALDAWPWRAELLAQLPARERHDIGEHLRTPGIAPATGSRLAEALLRRMDACRGTAARPRQPAPRPAASPLRWLSQLAKGRA